MGEQTPRSRRKKMASDGRVTTELSEWGKRVFECLPCGNVGKLAAPRIVKGESQADG